MRALWDENASSQRPWKCASQSGSGPYGHSCLPKLHQNQHVFLGEDSKDFIQEEKVPHQTTPWGICKTLLNILITLCHIECKTVIDCCFFIFKDVLKNPGYSYPQTWLSVHLFCRALIFVVAHIVRHRCQVNNYKRGIIDIKTGHLKVKRVKR